jgi:2-hydroxy-3-oxopropionate reductase
MLEGHFEPGSRTRPRLKDLRFALGLARETGVVLPATARVEQFMMGMHVAGRGDLDHSSLITVLEDLASHRVAPHAPAVA